MSEKEFASAMKTLGVAYGKEITPELLKVYYEVLKSETYSTMKKAIMETMKTKKFFPSIADLLTECKKQRSINGYAILDFMKSKGYFHESEYAISEYEKACRWLETGVIPEWFKEDMKEYEKMYKQEQLGASEQKRLNYE